MGHSEIERKKTADSLSKETPKEESWQEIMIDRNKIK